MVKMDKYREEFIDNLKRYRKEKKLSQAKLSELCNVATGTIANIECGLSKPSFDLILTIAKVLDVHPALLFSSNPLQADSANEIRQQQLLLELYAKLKSYFQEEKL